MTIHVFNPEHDIALGSNLEHFTAPHAGRQLRHDLGYLPALWAREGDLVLVDNVDASLKNLRKTGLATTATFVDYESLNRMLRLTTENIKVEPWGWDAALRSMLKGDSIATKWLPSNAQLNIIRLMSHRSWAAKNMLHPLCSIAGTVGESCQLNGVDDTRKFLAERKRIVLKAPWSSSGRGLRYASCVPDSNGIASHDMTPQLEGWINHVAARQGCVVGEPYYDKVCDFGMEFYSNGSGDISYKGLSLFSTSNGAYVGNILDDEEHKKALLCRYAPQHLLKKIRGKIEEILSEVFEGKYSGPFGVDMMVVRNADNGLAVHPCVELNLRMTMGYVSILIANKYKMEDKVMQIKFSDGSYRLRIGNV